MTIEDVLRTDSTRDRTKPCEQTIDAASLARVSREMAGAETTEQAVAQIILFVTQAFGTQFAGVTILRSRGKFATFGPTSDLVARADQFQYDDGEGPCIDAATKLRTVTCQNLAADARWPRWSRQATELGFVSVLSAELHVGGAPIGSLNMYGTRTGQFTPHHVRMAQIFASHAAVALAATRAVEELQQALENRTVIGQAQGILMNRLGVDGDQAFAILRRYSNEMNIKLVEIARGLAQTPSLSDWFHTDGVPNSHVDGSLQKEAGGLRKSDR